MHTNCLQIYDFLRYVQKKEGNDVYLRDIVISITMPFRKTFTQELMDYMRGI